MVRTSERKLAPASQQWEKTIDGSDSRCRGHSLKNLKPFPHPELSPLVTGGSSRNVTGTIVANSTFISVRPNMSGEAYVFWDKTMTASLLNIHRADIGKQKPGATPGEVTENIIDALRKTVNTTVANVDTSAVLGEARKEYAAARGKFEETGKTAVGGLKGLFGK